MWVEESEGGGRELTHCALNRAVTGDVHAMGCFVLKMFLIRECLIQHGHVVASAGLYVGLGMCVGQIASSKGLASKFLMVVITNIRMIAWGGRPRKDAGNSSHGMTMRWSFTPPKGGT